MLIWLLLFNKIDTNGQPLTFFHYGIESGLSQSVINYTYQDSDGFIWVATQYGLNKFNGYDFERYRNIPSDTNSLNNTWVYCVAEDQKRNIWIGTRGGLHCYDKKNGKITRFLHQSDAKSELYKDAIYGVAVDVWGNIITNTPPSINYFDPKTQKVTHYFNTIGLNSATEDQCFPVVIDSDGLLWISTIGGLACFNPKSKTFKNYIHDPNNSASISDNYISAIYEDRQKNLWIGTRNGLNKFNKQTQTFQRFYAEIGNKNSLSHNFIRSIIQDRNNKLWIGTDGGGLNKISFSGNSYEVDCFRNIKSKDPMYISHDVVLSLMIDRSYNLWIGTLNGLDKVNLKSQKFKLIQKNDSKSSVNLLDNVIASVLKEKDGTLWIGNWGKGLNKVNRKTGEVRHFTFASVGNNHISNDYAQVLFEDSKRNLWLGTRDGINIFDKKLDKFVPLRTFFNSQNLPDFAENRVNCIIEDQYHYIWVGTRNGLFKIDLNTLSYDVFKSGNNPELCISNNLVYAIVNDRNNNIWIGTSSGLDIYDRQKSTFSHLQKIEGVANSLCDNYIVSLFQDSNFDIWIGTQTGLNCYNPIKKIFSYFSDKDGLPSNFVYEIIQDKNLDMWFATVNGLCKYDVQNKKFRTYLTEDGLQGSEFNLRASYKSIDNELFFGGMNGLNSFYVDSIKDNAFIPQIVFTKLEISSAEGKRIITTDGLEQIELNADDYEFIIEFAALEFTNPSKNRYAYKLDGLADKWIEIGNRRFLPFPNLPAGEYTINIRGTNNDGIWNEEGAKLRIIVYPPWWKSWIAIFSYVCFIAISIFLFFRIRFRALRYQKAVLEHRVKLRTEEVESQKDEILLKNEELMDSHKKIIHQRDEIETQMEVVTLQRDQIVQQNKQITDSIFYAKRIQNAVLPPVDYIKSIIPEHFILFRPRDIVSGDFYWIKQIREQIVIAVADCTGHGVPGAFMSMLGYAAINEVVSKQMESWMDTSVSPAELLNELRERIKSSLRQTGKKDEQKDGMDIAVCIINTELNTLQFSGANNSIQIIRPSKTEEPAQYFELKPDKMPIGIYFGFEKSFNNQEFNLQKGDMLYVLTDGYKDQFGGEKGDKFKSKRMRELLNEIACFDVDKQQHILNDTLVAWMGESYEQIDDITVVGIRY